MPSAVVFLLVALILCGVAASTPSCPSMHFFVNEEGCRKCSECSEGQVMLRQCYGDMDTKCGLFPWSEFRGKPATDDEPSTPTSKAPSIDNETLVWPEKTEGDRWFTITMVLVVILVVAMVGGIVALLVLCYVCRQRKLRAMTEESTCVEEPLTKQSSVEQFTLVRET